MNSTEREPVGDQTPELSGLSLTKEEKIAVGLIPLAVALIVAIGGSPQAKCCLSLVPVSEIALWAALLGMPTRK